MPLHAPLLRSLCISGLLAVALLGGMGGCEAGPPASPEARRARFPIDYKTYGRIGYRPDWVGYPHLTSSATTVDLIAPSDDAVLALDSGGIVSCLSTRDGSTRWSDQLTGALTRFLSLDREGNQARVTSESELFVLDMATGNLAGRQAFARLVSTSPIPYGTNIIYGSGVGEVFAHIAISTVQKAKSWGHLLSAGIDRDLVLIGGTVGVTSRAGDVVFLDAASGALVGRNSMYKGAATHPVADGAAMYVASLDQSVYAFSPINGRLIWQHRTSVPLNQQPAVHANTLYVGVEGTGLVALDTATGQPRWSTPDVAGEVIAVRDGRLLVWDGQTATVVDPERGSVIDRVELARVRRLVPDKFVDGNLYAVSESGVVARFLPR